MIGIAEQLSPILLNDLRKFIRTEETLDFSFIRTQDWYAVTLDSGDFYFDEEKDLPALVRALKRNNVERIFLVDIHDLYNEATLGQILRVYQLSVSEEDLRNSQLFAYTENIAMFSDRLYFSECLKFIIYISTYRERLVVSGSMNFILMVIEDNPTDWDWIDFNCVFEDLLR